MAGLSKEDSSRIGFVVSCLFAEAINLHEFRQWVTTIYEGETEIPTYMVDLLDFNGPLFKLSKVIGFEPHWPGTEDEELALFGITYQRDRIPFQCPLNREEAIAKLERHPSIKETFIKNFPFLPKLG